MLEKSDGLVYCSNCGCSELVWVGDNIYECEKCGNLVDSEGREI